MEMMNIEAAIRATSNYTNFLAAARKSALETTGKTYADPIIAAHIRSLQEDFKELLRKALIYSTLFRRRMVPQIDLLLNFPGRLAELQNSLNALDLEIDEAKKAVRQIDPTCFDVPVENSKKAANEP
jgi:hypothetical protein